MAHPLAWISHNSNAAVKKFGFTSLESIQVKDSEFFFGSSNDVFAVLPTEYGKRLCYMCFGTLMMNKTEALSSIVVVLSLLVHQL